MIVLLEKFGKLRRKLNLHFTQGLKPVGIGPKQAIILRYLSLHVQSSLADLSRATVTDPAAINRAVAVMLKKGLLQRREHANDQRSWQVSLAAKGREKAGQVEKIYGAVAEKMASALSPGEKKLLAGMLDKMLDSFAPQAGRRTKKEVTL